MIQPSPPPVWSPASSAILSEISLAGWLSGNFTGIWNFTITRNFTVIYVCFRRQRRISQPGPAVFEVCIPALCPDYTRENSDGDITNMSEFGGRDTNMTRETPEEPKDVLPKLSHCKGEKTKREEKTGESMTTSRSRYRSSKSTNKHGNTTNK